VVSGLALPIDRYDERSVVNGSGQPHKSRLLLIAVGGTISMVRDPATGTSVPTLTAAELLTQTSLAAQLDIRPLDLVTQTGAGLRSADLLTLARFIEQEAKSDVDGVVVTHGTDTMEEVAFFIDEVTPVALPLVFTGAMRPSWAAGYDGVKNLENALRVAAAVPAEYGTLVTMNDEVFAAWSVYKADTGALDAFVARRGAPYGRIFANQIELAWRPVVRQRPGKIPPFLPQAIPILTMGVGDEAVLLERLPERPVQGVVIASIAAGSIPSLARQHILRLAKSGVTVVLCAGTASGRTAEDYYYPGAYADLMAAGVVIEDHLTPRKARIRLMISLGLQVPYVPFGREFVIPALG
jgi:L-asparaginase